MAYKVYLTSSFEPTSNEAAALIKVVGDDGRVSFYHPHKTDGANSDPASISANTQKTYNPNEPRDKDGKWTSGGSG